MASTAKRLMKAGVEFELYECSNSEYESSFDITVDFNDHGIGLVSYDADPEYMPVKRGQTEMLEKLLAEDSMAFIDFWCSGLMDKEGCFRAQKLFLRDRRGRLVTEDIMHETQLEITDDQCVEAYRRAVLVSDIFGRTVIKYDKITI